MPQQQQQQQQMIVDDIIAISKRLQLLLVQRDQYVANVNAHERVMQDSRRQIIDCSSMRNNLDQRMDTIMFRMEDVYSVIQQLQRCLADLETERTELDGLGKRLDQTIVDQRRRYNQARDAVLYDANMVKTIDAQLDSERTKLVSRHADKAD